MAANPTEQGAFKMAANPTEQGAFKIPTPRYKG